MSSAGGVRDPFSSGCWWVRVTSHRRRKGTAVAKSPAEGLFPPCFRGERPGGGRRNSSGDGKGE